MPKNKDQQSSLLPPIVSMGRPQLDLTPDPALLQSIQELSDSDHLLVWRDMEGELRWTRVPLSRVTGLTYGCPVQKQ